MSRPTSFDRSPHTHRRRLTAAALLLLLAPVASCAGDEVASDPTRSSSVIDGAQAATGADGEVTDGDGSEVVAGDYEAFTPPELVVEKGVEPEVAESDDAEALPMAERVDATYLDEAPEHERLALTETTCQGLGQLYLSTYQGVLDRLGDAGRDDTERIDEAMESFGAGGQLMSARFNELGCGDAERQAVACRGAERLTADGDVAQDLINILSAACDSQPTAEG